jgi:hypothetical protein
MENITIDEITKNAFWTPGEGNSTLAGVVITASDGFLSGDSNAFNITFVPVNDPPANIGGLKGKIVQEHNNWTADLSDYFRDEEDTAGLIYDASDPEITINRITHIARWSPSGNSSYSIDVVFTAHDSQNYSLMAVSGTIKLTYIPVNDPPVYLGKLQSVRLKPGEEWNITLEEQFRDDDTEVLRFSANNPDATIIEINKGKHCAVWRPDKHSSDITGLVFTAYDGATYVRSTPINLTVDRPTDPGNRISLTSVIQSIPWYVYVLLPIGIIGGIAGYYSYRRVRYGKYEIQQLFLIYNDGRLLAHRQKNDTPQVSNDILTGMLTALKGFIKESLQDQSKGDLDEMKYGDLKIAIEHGKTVYLAAFISGYITDRLKADMKDVLQRVEMVYEPVLMSWDGMMPAVEGIGPYLDELMGSTGQGKTAPPPTQ